MLYSHRKHRVEFGTIVNDGEHASVRMWKCNLGIALALHDSIDCRMITDVLDSSPGNLHCTIETPEYTSNAVLAILTPDGKVLMTDTYNTNGKRCCTLSDNTNSMQKYAPAKRELSFIRHLGVSGALEYMATLSTSTSVERDWYNYYLLVYNPESGTWEFTTTGNVDTDYLETTGLSPAP